MALNTNLTTSNTAPTTSDPRGNNLSPTMQSYYDRKLLETMKPKLVHCQFGQKRPIPRNNGKTIQFRKWTPFDAVTTALTEGTVPDGQALSQTAVTATVAQYGGYVAVSDLLDMTALDPVANDAVEMMADQGALSLDHIVRDVLTTSADATNVLYAASSGTAAASRSAITAAHKLTTLEIRKAVRALKKAKAPRISRGGRQYYVAIVGPDTTFDLQSDPLWVDVSKYQAKEQIYSGEIGRLFGVLFVETTEAKIFAGAGASDADVAATLVLGRDAYGLIDIEGSGAVRTLVKPRGSAGTADPLNQISTVGWKAAAFTAKILQPLWMIRIEHGISA